MALTFSESPTSTTPVPSLIPRIPSPTTRLAVIGEAPGADEVVAGEPFVGVSGRYLRAILASCGGVTHHTFFGNVTPYQPPNNDITRFDFNGPEIQSGLVTLAQDLEKFQPHCLLLLGKTAFRAFRPDLCYPTKKGYYVPLNNWRGSLFHATLNGVSYKCCATYHPAYILRSFNDSPFFRFDVARAVRHSSNPSLTLVNRVGNLRPTVDQVLTYLHRARASCIPQTFDIEGYPDTTGITMVSFVPTADPTTGIVIPFWIDSRNYWSEEDEILIWRALADLLADPHVAKTAHNCFYELFVFAWRHRCIVNNLADDTMMMHWERYPDFAKGDDESKPKVSTTQKKRSLAVCCSLYTEQPYYKDDRLSDNTETKLNYNFLDSSITAECRNVCDSSLRAVPESYNHYRFNLSLVPAFNYIMLRGCRFDASQAQTLASVVKKDITTLNQEINQELIRRGVFDIFPCASEKKRTLDGFNVKSPTQKCWLLYDHLQCTPLKRWGRTSDEDALLHFWKKTNDPLLRLVIRCVRHRTRLSDIHKLTPSTSGRILTSYDPCGTNTGRPSSRASMALQLNTDGEWDNIGTNTQNQAKDLRVCFIPDTPNHDFFQCDLSGADAWTVAAELAALGHSTMLEDLLFGIKPSLVLCYMVRAHAAGRDPNIVNHLSRDDLKSETLAIKHFFDSVEGQHDTTGQPLDWLYICSKRVQHGSNYNMQAERTTELVFSDSDGTINLTKKDAELYQHFYKLRYKTDARNRWIRKTLEGSACIVSSCGVRRQFFSIRNRREVDDGTVREASAFNPQCNTAHITNRALAALWYDPTNRTSHGGLFIEPFFLIHDALAGQYHSKNRTFAGQKLREWFTNPLKVQGITITIPVDCKYGPNWRDTKTLIPTS